jgi:hypothetical protein
LFHYGEKSAFGGSVNDFRASSGCPSFMDGN